MKSPTTALFQDTLITTFDKKLKQSYRNIVSYFSVNRVSEENMNKEIVDLMI